MRETTRNLSFYTETVKRQAEKKREMKFPQQPLEMVENILTCSDNSRTSSGNDWRVVISQKNVNLYFKKCRMHGCMEIRNSSPRENMRKSTEQALKVKFHNSAYIVII